ncbi:MAG: heparinase II/III-family protein [Phycisphaerae bacterium]|nr:heparinase II/III-family protein [Phycisphaerae bacterium]
MRESNSIIIFVIMLLFLCVAITAASTPDEIMAIPEGHLLAASDDPNHIRPATPVLIDNDAIAAIVKAYKQIGDDKYARQLAAVLYRFSQDYKGVGSGAVTFEPVDGIEMVLLQAYLTIKDTAAIKKLSKEIRVDVAKAIENDLIRAMADSVIKEHQKKMASGNYADRPAQIFPDYLADIALVGRAINEPDYIRVVYRYLSEPGNYARGDDGEGLTFDMHSTQGQQRHLELCRRINMIFGAVEGYSDPVGFNDGQGRRYDDVSLEDFPHVQRILGVLAGYALPDGQMNLIGDSAGRKICEPLKESTNVLLAGYGHALLGAGSGGDQSQVQLHFSGQGGGGAHNDCLSLVWYAHGRQMSGEIGGVGDNLRSWASSTLSHNTVLVDRQEQSGGDTFGNVLLYDNDSDGLSVIQVDGARAYRHLGVKTYRRTIIHNTIDKTRPYFVDVFEVEGGQIHDYSVHGSVFGDTEAVCSLDMQRMDGERPLLDGAISADDPCGIYGALPLPSSGYRAIGNVDSALAGKDFNVTFAYGGDNDTGTRIHMLADPATEVFLGETDALRSGGDYAGDKGGDRNVPVLIARRKGEKGLRSTFVAVYDMFAGGAKIKSVKRLISSDAFVALEIDLGGRVDKLFYCPGGNRSMIGGSVQMKGRLGLVTETGPVLQGYLIGGTILRQSPMMVRMKKASYVGGILTAMRKDAGDGRNAFTVDTILPTGEELSGKWMIVTYAMSAGMTASDDASKPQLARRDVTRAYQIDRVQREGVKMVVYLMDDHGLKIESGRAKEIFSKWRDFSGPGRFVIYTSVKSLPR